MNEVFSATGGARIGFVNATFPLARLTASHDSLHIKVLILGEYHFTPDTVIAITRYTMVPVLGWGIRIRHSVSDYPASFIFWCLGDPERLLAGIRETGFEPRSPIPTTPERSGLAIRWSAIVIAIIVWNGLFMFTYGRLLNLPSNHTKHPIPWFPGPLVLLAVGLLFVAAAATLYVPAFQRLVLKPGRNVGEIRPLLNLLLLVAGFMFIILLLLNLLAPIPAQPHQF